MIMPNVHNHNNIRVKAVTSVYLMSIVVSISAVEGVVSLTT